MLTPTQQLQSYYLAMFGRAADPEGLDYWSSELEAQTLRLEEVLQYMVLSSEFAAQRETLAQLDNSGWVNEAYQRLFAREAEAEGITYWSEQARAGNSPETLLLAMLNGAEGTDAEALKAYASIAEFYSANVSDENYDAAKVLVQEGFRSNEQLYQDLEDLDEIYDTLSLVQAGESLEGRPLYSATVGDGPRKLMIVTQQHGDEPVGTEAAMHLLEWISGDSEAAQSLREQVTLTVMPRVNPDGFERWEQLVAGESDPETTLDPRRNAADIDLNRTWDSTEDLDPALMPETLAVRAVLDAFQPELLLDYHNQNNYLNEAGELETMSALWPTNENVDPALTATAQQAAIALSQGVDLFDYGHLSLFPGGDDASIGRNGIALDGTSALLIEQRGLEEFELKSLEGLELDFDAVASALTLEGILSMIGVMSALGEDGFASIDPALALLLPERGERTPFEELYAEESGNETDAALQGGQSPEDILEIAAAGVAAPIEPEFQLA
ncbi:M14 family zinc carboxypeptidase [Vreelandella sp. EE27]